MTLSDMAEVLDVQPARSKRYAICTIVSRISDYVEMHRSFVSHGFDTESTQFIVADNTNGNQYDAFSAYNRFLTEAKAEYIILCHQDIILLDHDRNYLDKIISDMDGLDPKWGLFGNAGRTENNIFVSMITDPHSPDGKVMGGPLPRRVISLDENFIVTKRSANLALSHNLAGFHYYGSDMCIIADILGLSAYVVEFSLLHRSAGFTDRAFFANRREIQRKFLKAFRTRPIHVTTGHSFVLSGAGVRILGDRLKRRMIHIYRTIVGRPARG